MSIEYLGLMVAIFVLLILSAFFSGSETALTAASQPRMHELAPCSDTCACVLYISSPIPYPRHERE